MNASWNPGSSMNSRSQKSGLALLRARQAGQTLTSATILAQTVSVSGRPFITLPHPVHKDL
jgi:hypothetical protein